MQVSGKQCFCCLLFSELNIIEIKFRQRMADESSLPEFYDL